MRAWAHSPCPLLFYNTMVTIEQLRISPDGQKLYIDAHINKASYFENLKLDSIKIDTQNTVLQSFDGPSNTPVFAYTNTPSSHIVKVTKSPIVLSEHSFIKSLDIETGVLIINVVPEKNSNETYVTLGFRGENSVFSSKSLALKVTSLGADGPIHYVPGTIIDNDSHLWEFKDKFAIGDYSKFAITLVNMKESGEVVPINFNNTRNTNSLIFVYDIYTEYLIQDLKEVHLVVDKNDIKADLSKDMLYVYFHVTGTPSSNTPCRLDEAYTLGVTFNEVAIYNRMMGYTKEIMNTCEVPRGFIDMILQLEAIKAAIETENYASANKFYNRLINTKFSNTSSINCGCHG